MDVGLRKLSRILKEKSERVDGALDRKWSSGSDCAGDATAQESTCTREGGTRCEVVQRIPVELLHARAQLLDGCFIFHIQDIASLQYGVEVRQKLKSYVDYLRSSSQCYIVLEQTCRPVLQVFKKYDMHKD